MGIGHYVRNMGLGHYEGITRYFDSNYAGDIESGRSTSGFVFCFGASPITLYSKKQPIVALSSTEAKYRALSKAIREAVWLRTLLGDYGLESRTNFYQL